MNIMLLLHGVSSVTSLFSDLTRQLVLQVILVPQIHLSTQDNQLHNYVQTILCLVSTHDIIVRIMIIYAVQWTVLIG